MYYVIINKNNEFVLADNFSPLLNQDDKPVTGTNFRFALITDEYYANQYAEDYKCVSMWDNVHPVHNVWNCAFI